MWVDFHWHARDWKQSHKDTVARSLAIAEASSIDAIAAMPNTDPPLLDLDTCKAYLNLRPRDSPVQFYVHIGLTKNVEQVKRAVDAVRSDSRIIGMKAYWGHSTGNMGIVEYDDQARVFEALAQENYKGVLVGHFEDEHVMCDRMYDPKNKKSWSTHCRPEDAEISSVSKIIGMAESVNFQGKIHIAHVSTLYAADIVADYSGPFKLSCGVTPHHIFFNNDRLNKDNGEFFLCNPPLRDEKTREGLMERVLKGKIRIVESDHAPHCEEDKRKKEGRPASGVVNGTAIPFIVKELKAMGMSDAQLADAFFFNPVRLYGLEGRFARTYGNVDYDRLRSLQAFYPFDPFANMKRPKLF